MISEELIQRIKTKDRDAFKELFDMYKEKVYRMSYIILRGKKCSRRCTSGGFYSSVSKDKRFKTYKCF